MDWFADMSEEDKSKYREFRRERSKERYRNSPELRERIKEDCYKRYLALREAVLSHLGGRCISEYCTSIGSDGLMGCNDSRCLQIDHVNSDGALARKSKGQQGATFYRKVLKCVPGIEYQLLCANCNWIKRHCKQELPQARIVSESSSVFIDSRKHRRKDSAGKFLPVNKEHSWQ